MSRAIARRQVGYLASSSTTTILLLAAAALVIYLLLKRQGTAQYTNAETWSVEYNADGLPTKVVIHRDAKQT